MEIANGLLNQIGFNLIYSYTKKNTPFATRLNKRIVESCNVDDIAIFPRCTLHR